MEDGHVGVVVPGWNHCGSRNQNPSRKERKMIRPRKGSKAAIVRAFVVQYLEKNEKAPFSKLVTECLKEYPEVPYDTVRMAVYQIGRTNMIIRDKSGYALKKDSNKEVENEVKPDIDHMA